MYALLPILAFLATANAAPVAINNVEVVDKRACLDPFGILCAGTAATTTAKAVVTTTAVVVPTTTAKVNTTTSATTPATNVVQTIVNAPVQVVSAVLKCPLDPTGLLNLCKDANTGATTTAAAPTTTSTATTAATTTTGSGNVVSVIVAPVASAASAVVAPIVSPVVSAASGAVAPVVSPVASAVSSVVAPVVSAASSVVAPVASAASSVVAPVASAASSVVAPVVSPVASVASSVLNPVASAAVSVVAPVVTAASSVVNPAASAAASVVAPVVSSAVSVVAPAASSVSSIISSVTAAASSSSSAVVVVTPTSTASSSSASPSASAAPGNANVANWAYTSCVQEGTNGRALTGSSFGGSGMTVESCLASCDAGGFMYAGLEYGQECWCGSTLANGAALTKTGTCDMACSGNAKELCGGSSTLSLYTSTKVKTPAQAPALPAGWSSTTCMNEVSGRAFTKSSFASDDMTVNKCIAFCGSGSKYAAVEYGRECYCGTSVDNGASLTSTSGQCNVPCAGLASQTCGGPNALQVYTNAGYKSASAGAYSNTGCVQEVDGRLLRGASIASDNMTIETCTSFCQSQGFAIAGLEYARECYCGSSYVSTPLQSGQCNMPCAGNSGENCGGPNALNIFTLGGV